MRQTEKYQFNLIDPEDHFLPDPLNENMEKTEAALKGSVRIATGTYVGTGTCGRDNPCTLTFDFTPKFIMVYGEDMGSLTGYECCLDEMAAHWPSSTLIAAYGATRSGGCRIQQVTDHLIWGTNSFTWYSVNPYSSTSNANAQLNAKNTTYFYLALG